MQRHSKQVKEERQGVVKRHLLVIQRQAETNRAQELIPSFYPKQCPNSQSETNAIVSANDAR